MKRQLAILLSGILLAACGGGGGGGGGGDTAGSSDTELASYLEDKKMEGALGDCVRREAAASGWTSPEEVTALDCSYSSLYYAPMTLEGIEGFVNLEELYVHPTREFLATDEPVQGGIHSTEPLRSLGKLRVLVLMYQQIGELSLPERCTLETLDVSTNPLASIDAVARCKSLQSLGMAATDVTDLSPLEGLLALEMLDISVNDVHDLSPLSSTTGLKRLFMDYLGASYSTGAQYAEDQEIVLPEFFGDFTGLEYFSARSMYIANLSLLHGAKGLVYLDLGSSKLQASVLLPFTQLRYLFLSKASVSDIEYLAGLTELEILDLSEIEFVERSRYSWSFLGNLDGLQQLALANSGFDNIYTLLDMDALELVTLENADIENLALLADLPSLSGIHLGINGLDYYERSTCEQIQDLKALRSDIAIDYGASCE
ncbi:MAG TPA: hypothetical protein VF267_08070 [Gammaproteobacteria bacterium]